MARWLSRAACIVLCSMFTGSELLPEDKNPPKKTPAKEEKKPAAAAKPGTAKGQTHKVEKAPFKIEVSLKGIFEATQMTGMSLRPEAWTPENRGMLTVMKAVEQGAHVKKGDTLVWLDLEKIDQAIRDVESERRLTDIAISQAEKELPILEKSTPMELELTQRAKALADEDLKWFTSVDRPLAEKIVQFMVKRSGNYLDYAKEELRQLEKMYRSNDIREETEEIILKRQRDEVEDAAFIVETTQSRREQVLRVDLPRREQHLKENVLRQAITLDKNKAILPLQLSQKSLALDKMKYERDKAEDRLGKLKKDRASMTVTSPADGVVYYGQCTRGHWNSAGTMAHKLQPGGNLSPDEVFITIVQERPIFVRAEIEEKELHDVHAGAEARVVSVADPECKEAARVEQVSAIPVTPGNFEARLSLKGDKEPQEVVAGMACTVKLTPYVKKDALIVPAKAVFPDELDDDKHFVYLQPKDGKPEKRPVKVGRTSESNTEITDGLKEGDEILLEKPKPETGK